MSHLLFSYVQSLNNSQNFVIYKFYSIIILYLKINYYLIYQRKLYPVSIHRRKTCVYIVESGTEMTHACTVLWKNHTMKNEHANT
jgi:hypothetical protein